MLTGERIRFSSIRNDIATRRDHLHLQRGTTRVDRQQVSRFHCFRPILARGPVRSDAINKTRIFLQQLRNPTIPEIRDFKLGCDRSMIAKMIQMPVRDDGMIEMIQLGHIR